MAMEEVTEHVLPRDTDAGTPLVERFQSEVTPMQKYQDMFVGNRSLWALLKYELLVPWVSMLPGGLGYVLRKHFFKRVFGHVGDGVLFGRNLTIRCPGRISLGNGVVIDDGVVLDAKGAPNRSYIRLGDNILLGRNAILSCTDAHIEFGDYISTGPNCYFTTKSHIHVGSYVSIGPNTYVIGGGHSITNPNEAIIKQERISKGVVIEDNTWIGAGTLILDGAVVREGSIIGAGAVVKGEIPPYVVAVGMPARVIRSRE